MSGKDVKVLAVPCNTVIHPAKLNCMGHLLNNIEITIAGIPDYVEVEW